MILFQVYELHQIGLKDHLLKYILLFICLFKEFSSHGLFIDVGKNDGWFVQNGANSTVGRIN